MVKTKIGEAVDIFIEKHLLVILLAAAIMVTVLLSVTPVQSESVSFNEHYIEELDGKKSVVQTNGGIDTLLGNYKARLNIFFGKAEDNKFDFNNPDSVFSVVFSKISSSATVYPTEMYYYFILSSQDVWGNLNFKDIKEGKLSFAYFDAKNAENFKHKMYGTSDGISVKVISDNVIKLSYKSKTVTFTLPEAIIQKPESLSLLQDEEFVAKVTDESGVRFYLVFNNKTNSFYYILSEEKPLTETAKDIGDNMILGERTGYVYYSDTERGRKILIGVNSYNVMKNNYFDGAFDQVPPRLAIREKIYKAYPYTQYMNGIDEHGNFFDWKGSRVAISPYTNYFADTEEVRAVVKKCEDDLADESIFWSCLTYETKKDFHKTIPEFFYPDGRKK